MREISGGRVRTKAVPVAMTRVALRIGRAARRPRRPPRPPPAEAVTTGARGLRLFRQKVSGPMDWRSKAACLDKDPELFFPVGNTGPALLQIEEAKAVCRSCEVVDTCLKWAMESGQDSGVWGGMSEDERRAMKRRAARARRAS